MMKMMILAPRRTGLSHAEFRRYVTEVHGPLVKSIPEVAGAIRHYHYNFPVPGAEDRAFGHPTAAHLDIVTQGWFDSREAQLANMREPRYLEIVRPDEHRFADGAGAVMHYTHEISMVSGTALSAPSKAFYFRRRRAHLSREAFQVAWRTRYAAALTASAASQDVFSKYIQNHTLSEADHPDGSATRYFDVIDEMFLRAPAALGHFQQDPTALTRLRILEDELLEPGYTRFLLTETIVNS
jgi:hypothetical protein